MGKSNYYEVDHPETFRKYEEEDLTVDYDYNLTICELESYFKTNNIQDGSFYKEYEEYIETSLNTKEDPFYKLLNHLINEKILIDNKELYSEISIFLDYASQNDILHKNKKEKYHNALKSTLFKNNKDYIKDDDVVNLEVLDYSKYEINNFRETYSNKAINSIHEKGGTIYLNSDGMICCKLSKESELKIYSKSKAGMMLSKLLAYPVQITEKIRKSEEINPYDKKDVLSISIHDLILVEGERFRPRVLKEYFEEDGVSYINTFKPTSYMKLKGNYTRLPKTILDLFFHLANYNEEKYNHMLNNLAYFFKYLKRSMIAIVLIGKQGAGKGILFDAILTKLFGSDYCITINNESIDSKYKAKIIKDKLYYNFDEVKLTTSKKNDSFIKSVITNPFITLEEKNVTMNKEIQLFGQCLFTSNHMDALSIEDSDRRFTVIGTGDNLVNTNFLHYGSYKYLVAGINQDLDDFARYLKNYDVDISRANKPLDTAEKRAIKNSLRDNLIEFHEAIIRTDSDYFYDLQGDKGSLYFKMKYDFERNVINRANIAKAYNKLFSKNISSKGLLKKLRSIEPYYVFQKENLTHSGSDHYFNLAK